MEKQNKENFLELPLHAFKKKLQPIPQFLIESKLQRTNKNLAQLKKIIESQEYICLAVISEERNIFCVKLTSNDKLGIIQVKQVSAKNRCIYVSLNINSFLKKEIRPYFLMKNWKIQNKIWIEDQRSSGIALLQYNFAQMDLRNFINRHQQMGCKLPEDVMRKLSKDLIENLCKYHLEQTTILDIRPETILFQDGKWFILNGDNTSKAFNQFGSTLSKPISLRFTDRRYLSPIILQSQLKSDYNIIHNPYKSDVFSLGLVLLELLSLGNTESQHILKDLLQNRKDLKEIINNYELSFRQKLLIVGQKMLKLPNILTQMLAQKEQNRSYIFEICLKMNFNQSLTEKILPTYDLFFKKQVIDQNLPNRKRIIYTQSPIQYEGQIDFDAFQERQELIRSGRGSIFYNGLKVFEGQWQNNLPNGKCTAQFSSLLSYQGHMENGRLHGQGMLSFNGSRLGQSRWHQGVIEEKSMRKFDQEAMEKGYYLFTEKPNSNRQYLVYYNKVLNTSIQFILNLCGVKKLANIIQVLKKFFKSYEVKSICLKGKSYNYLYHFDFFELVMFQIADQNKAIFKVDILTDIQFSVPLVIKLLRQGKIKLDEVEFDCSQNTLLSQDLFRQLAQLIPFKSLNFSGCTQFSDNAIRYIAQSKQFSKLKRLQLSKTNITDKGLNQLLYFSALQNVQKINISDCKKLSSQKITQFFCHQNASNFQQINISGLAIDHIGFQKILSLSSLRKLKSISMGMCPKISQNLVSDFLKLPNLSRLEKLKIYTTVYKDSILEILGSETTIKDLKQIDLSGNINFTPEGFSKYFLSYNIIALKVLNLSNTQISDQLLCLLSKKSSISHSVIELKISSCYQLTDKGIRQLLRPQHFINLHNLDLSKNNFSNDTLFVLSQVTSRELLVLNVSKCSKMNDIGFQKLLNSQNARSLRQLNIKGTGIKSTPFITLCNSKYTTSLKLLNLSECLQLDQSSFLRYASSHRIALLQQILLCNTLITQSTLKAIEFNAHLYNCIIKFNTQGCKNITNQMRKSLCLMKKIIELPREQPIMKSEAASLAKNTLLTKLSEIQINKKEVPKLQKIFQSQYVINLEKLSLNWINLDATLSSINKNINLNNLKHFNISGSAFDQERLQTFFKSNISKNITYLDLSWTNCSNKTLNAIADSLNLNSLRVLKIAKCTKINDKGFVKYFASPKASVLTQIDLRSTLITNTTLQTIFGSKFLKNLSILCLRSCQNIKVNGFKQYFRTSACSSLKDLDIGWTKVSGQIFSLMSSSKKLNQLYSLRIAGLKSIQVQLCKFVQSTAASSLTLLDANYAELSSKFVHSLESSRYLSGLEELHFKGYELFDSNISALSAFIRSSNSSKLNTLKLSKTKAANINKLCKELSHYMGKIQQLCIIGLTQLQLQQWQNTLKTCSITNKDVSNEIQ